MNNYTKCSRCANSKQREDMLYCCVCDLWNQENLKFEDFNSADEYYFQIFNGDEQAIWQHKQLLDGWYGLSPREISLRFSKKYKLGTAADRIRRIFNRLDLHDPSDIMSLNACPVIIDGKRYNSLQNYVDLHPNKDKQAQMQNLRTLIYKNKGLVKKTRHLSRGVKTIKLIIDEDLDWADRGKNKNKIKTRKKKV